MARPFNAETARAAAILGHAARRARKARNEAARQIAAALIIEAPPVIPEAPPAFDYVGRRLARVRAQLDKLDELIAGEMTSARPDPARLDRYASAQARLATQEQQLAGRPLPGSRRPGKDRSRPAGGAGADVEPLD